MNIYRGEVRIHISVGIGMHCYDKFLSVGHSAVVVWRHSRDIIVIKKFLSIRIIFFFHQVTEILFNSYTNSISWSKLMLRLLELREILDGRSRSGVVGRGLEAIDSRLVDPCRGGSKNFCN